MACRSGTGRWLKREGLRRSGRGAFLEARVSARAEGEIHAERTFSWRSQTFTYALGSYGWLNAPSSASPRRLRESSTGSRISSKALDREGWEVEARRRDAGERSMRLRLAGGGAVGRWGGRSGRSRLASSAGERGGGGMAEATGGAESRVRGRRSRDGRRENAVGTPAEVGGEEEEKVSVGMGAFGYKLFCGRTRLSV
jgi:hypothetical protein